jgi:hypothetical protein
MAKKVRRVRRRSGRDKNLGPQQAADAPTDEKRSRSQTRAAIPEDQQLEEEYAYVLQDLRRVFVLAAVLFVLLIALNLLLG